MNRITNKDVLLPNGILVQEHTQPTVTILKARGPALAEGEVTFHPNFKFTACPAPKLGLRTNTHTKSA